LASLDEEEITVRYRKTAALAVQVLLSVVIAGLASSVCSGQVLTTEDLAIELRPEALARGRLGELTLRSLPSDFAEAVGHLVLRDGRAHQDLALADATYWVDEGALVSEWVLPKDLHVGARLTSHSAHLSLILTFDNRGEEQRWLEAGVNLDLAMGADWEFWDGLNTVSGAPALAHMRDTLPGVFPAAAVYTPQAGVALGIEPMQLLSYLRSSVTSDDGRDACFEYATRIVVDPGTSEQVEFVLTAFEGRHGHFGVLQRYANEFPVAFSPRPEADPRVSLAGAQYLAWSVNNPEMCRRTYSGWEWAYAPFRRTGDIYGHREFWEYTPARPFGRPRGLAYEEYHQWRKEAFLRGVDCDVAMLFYVPAGIWVEKQLADEVYSEARVRESGVTTIMDRPWVTGHDNEYRVFPFGNAYAEVFREDMRRVVEELNIQGFAFDVANGGVRVHAQNTQGVMKAPGRAYDDQGVFVEEGVAIALLMDYARTLKKDDRPMTVVSNPSASGVYMTIFRSDAAMFEAVPWGAHGTRPEHLRARLGHKTLVWWENWEIEETLNTDQSAAAVREAFLGMVDYAILKSIELGALPGTAYVRGVPPLGQALPMLVELVQAGWQPVPAIAGAPEGLWLSRFGHGGRSYVAAGNATLSPFEGTLTVDGTYLGDMDYFFTHFDGEALHNTVTDRSTSLDVAIPSRRPFVGRAALGVQSLTRGAVGALVSQEDDLASITTRVVFDLTSSQRLSFAIEPPEGYSLVRIDLNGCALTGQTVDGVSTFADEVADGDVLQIHYRSDVYRVSRADLLAFDFASPTLGSQAVVTLPGNPSEGELYAAYRLQKYFADYIQAWLSDCQGVLASGGAQLGRDMWWIPQVFSGDVASSWHLIAFTDDFFGRIKREAQEPASNRPRVILADSLEGADANGVIELRDDGQTLFIGAGDEKRLTRLLVDVLHQLDTKYAYFGSLARPLQHEAPQCY
jgi:hypothetical protein